MAKRQRYLWVCVNERAPGHPKGCCASAGGAQLRDELKRGLAERGLHRQLRVCASSCLDLCWVGPALAVMPDGVFYGRVQLADVGPILDALEAGEVVERLVLQPDAFDDPAKKLAVPPAGDGQ